MTLILEIRSLESQGKLESHHHEYHTEMAKDEYWKYTTIFTHSIPDSQNGGRNFLYSIYCKLLLKNNFWRYSRMESDKIYLVNP